MTRFEDDHAQTIVKFVQALVLESPQNRLEYLDNSPVSEEPLVGFADANDPLIARFKDAVGTFHLSPQELWRQTFPEEEPEHLSIIAWVLPLSKTIRDSNRRRRRQPSPHWGHARFYAEVLNNQTRSELVSFLTERGYRAVAPAQSPHFKVFWDKPEGPVSNWSERHYCLAAGLGTFGLNRGLITEKGQAMRCGTVVTDLKLPATERRFSSHTAYCPYLEVGAAACASSAAPRAASPPRARTTSSASTTYRKTWATSLPNTSPRKSCAILGERCKAHCNSAGCATPGCPARRGHPRSASSRAKGRAQSGQEKHQGHDSPGEKGDSQVVIDGQGRCLHKSGTC
ncbi:MAG TPA: hypothetical protein G4O03_05255 [Dehalococcoidia bacterium]|nr:hypothetical protein [Dehalococcoidia bacterium]